MNSLTTEIPFVTPNYSITTSASMVFASIAVLISLFILILVSLTKQLHTVIHLLTCDTCCASILLCITQFNNYIYLFLITWDTSDQSCRWRGYFGYLSVVAVIYSYLLQALSRFFFTILSTKYRRITTLKTHLYLIFIKWIVVFILPLPELLTKDIIFQKNFFCWVPKTSMLHIMYTIIMYYLIPIILMTGIYVFIYIRICQSGNHAVAVVQGNKRRHNRDLEVLRNMLILFSIYILGAVPTLLNMLTSIDFLYTVSFITIPMTVAVEKFVSLLLDREIRNACKKYFCRRTRRVMPIVANAFLPIQ